MLRNDDSPKHEISDSSGGIEKRSGSIEKRSGSIFAGMSPIQRSLSSAFAGFVLYGVWAFWANYQYGAMIALKAAFVQGSYSFILTLCMTMLLEAIFRFNARVFSKQHLINWLTVTVCCALIFSSSWLINVMAGTPEIFRTVVLGYIVGSIYSILYVRGLANGTE